MSIRWLGLVFIFLIVFIFRAFFYDFYRLPSTSMYPDFDQGSYVVVNKFGYGNYEALGISLFKSSLTSAINRGDVIVFKYPNNKDFDYIKRVIGVPGDKLFYKNKKLFVNGDKLEIKKIFDTDTYEIYEEKIDNAVYRIANTPARKSGTFEFIVPEGKYFVMGDNRDNSNDSRYWGFVPGTDIVGSVVHVFDVD